MQSYILAVAAPERRTQGATIIVFGFQGGMIAGMAIGSLLVINLGPGGVFMLGAVAAVLIALYASVVIPAEASRARIEGELAGTLGQLRRELLQALRSRSLLATIGLVGLPAKAVLTGVIVFALPLLLISSASISDERAILLHGYRFWPVGLSLEAYRYIARDPTQLLTGYRLSFLTTALGTILGLLLCSSLAYALSRRQFRLRNVLAFLVYFPILFQGGLVPFYILVTKYLGLKDTLLALILPSAVVPWYVLILRTYMRGLPEELLDAARVDGAGEVRIYFQIALPLCLPALTTVGLFYVLLYWNDWFTPLLFITRPSLTPLQYLLYRTMADLQFGRASCRERV